MYSIHSQNDWNENESQPHTLHSARPAYTIRWSMATQRLRCAHITLIIYPTFWVYISSFRQTKYMWIHFLRYWHDQAIKRIECVGFRIVWALYHAYVMGSDDVDLEFIFWSNCGLFTGIMLLKRFISRFKYCIFMAWIDYTNCDRRIARLCFTNGYVKW